MRTCVKCGAGENPIGRTRFRKSRIDHKIYCENCENTSVEASAEVPPSVLAASLPTRKPSAGYVVVRCPDCAGQPCTSSPECPACAGYGSVRIEASLLNVYRPAPMKKPKILTED